MVDVLTIKKMSYLAVGLFDDLVARFRINICEIKIFACAVCLNSVVARKEIMPFPLSHIIYCNRRLLSSIQTKTFPLNPVLQIDAIIV